MINIFIFLGKFNVFLCFIYKELIYKDANGLFLNTRNIPYQGCRPKPDTRNPAFFCTRNPIPELKIFQPETRTRYFFQPETRDPKLVKTRNLYPKT